jgi:hypothetical protein
VWNEVEGIQSSSFTLAELSSASFSELRISIGKEKTVLSKLEIKAVKRVAGREFLSQKSKSFSSATPSTLPKVSQDPAAKKEEEIVNPKVSLQVLVALL